jgi:hypothetical protein
MLLAAETNPLDVNNRRRGELAPVFLHAAAFGAVLPHVYFVNDLSHPFQTGLLVSLFPAGRLIGDAVSRRLGWLGSSKRLLALQGIGLVLTYLLVAGSAALYPTGIAGLRLAQVAWFLVGLMRTHLLFRNRDSNTGGRAWKIDLNLCGISAGAALSSALTWGQIRSPLRYTLGEAMTPALFAAGLTAIAVSMSFFMQPRRDGADRKGSAISLGMVIGAIAIPCTLAPMMLWESFGFSPSGVALMLAKAGFLAVLLQIIVRSTLDRSHSAALSRGVTAIGLCALFVSSNALSWSPQTGSGPLLFSGIATLAIGWACLRPTLFAKNGISGEIGLAFDQRLLSVAWLCGAILSASVFYAHERTSFALGGVITIFAGLWWLREIRTASRRTQIEEGAVQTETTRDGAAWISR